MNTPIIVKKGLDVPLEGKPSGVLQNLPHPEFVSLNLEPFDDLRFRLLVKIGDSVLIGQPLLENKKDPGQFFVSPAAGTIADIKRGLKRQLLDIVIQTSSQEKDFERQPLDPNHASRNELIQRFKEGGLFPHIRSLPFNLLGHSQDLPRDIFVTAYETRPFAPSFEMQITENEKNFQAGLNTLARLTEGKVHLVYKQSTESKALLEAKNVVKHPAQGPHPAGLSSVHIHMIAPINRPDDKVWKLNALDVIVIGKMVTEGRYHHNRVLSIAGNSILPEKRGFFKGRLGYPIKDLVDGRLVNQPLYLISGDPLTGNKVEADGFLNFEHTCFSAIPIPTKREFFHFLRLGRGKFTATRTFMTGHKKAPEEGYTFTTSQHGEERPFIDSHVYDKVMPMRIPTAFLIKAILAEDFELAEQLGLLEVTPEVFALPTFICPSKIEMVDIVRQGLRSYAKEMGH